MALVIRPQVPPARPLSAILILLPSRPPVPAQRPPTEEDLGSSSLAKKQDHPWRS